MRPNRYLRRRQRDRLPKMSPQAWDEYRMRRERDGEAQARRWLARQEAS